MEEWDAWAADADADVTVDADVHANAKNLASPPDDAQVAESRTLGLWEVEQRLFADNASARAVLDALGLEVLDEKEARSVLKLRVELAG